MAPVGLDVAQRVVEDGQVAQAQEVHLEQAEGLAGPHVQLGDDRAVLLAAHDRDDVEQRLGRQDHAGRVDAPLPAQALEPTGGVDDLAQVVLALVQRAEVRGLLVARVGLVEDPRQRDVLAHDRRRHRLGQLLPHGERVAEHARGVLQGGLGLDRRVGDDLGDALLAVALRGVADHLGAPALVEVHVDVGHRDALGVQEPLEQQPVAHRVELGDAQGVGDEGAGGRATARAHADPDALGVLDEVGGDQEVPREAHLADDAHLVGGLVAAVLGHPVGEPPGQAALDLLDQPRLLGLPLGDREPGHQVAALGELDVAPLGHQQRVVAGLGVLGPERAHLLGGLQVEVAGVELEAVRVGHGLAGLHAQQDLMGLRIRGVGVVQVVGREQRQREVLGQAQEVGTRAALDLDAVVHELAVEVVPAEDVAVVGGGLARLLVLADLQPAVDLARRAAGGRDDPRAVPLEEVTVEARVLAVLALQAGQRGDPEQVVQALVVLGQQGHMRVVDLALGGALVPDVLADVSPERERRTVEARADRDVVPLHADDRLHSGGRAGLPELVGAEQVAMVGDRQRRHLHAGGLGEELLDPGGPVEHRVLGVGVQVHEVTTRAGRHRRPPGGLPRTMDCCGPGGGRRARAGVNRTAGHRHPRRSDTEHPPVPA